MNKEIISDALNLLHDDIIEEVELARDFNGNLHNNQTKWIIITSLTCLELLVIAISLSLSINNNQIVNHHPIQKIPSNDLKELPQLSIGNFTSEGNGYSGIWVYDINEYTNNNPWDETMQLQTMPVYRNMVTTNDNYQHLWVDYNYMHDFLLDTAKRLKIDSNSLIITNNYNLYRPSIIGKTDDIEIEVSLDDIVIHFDSTISLPLNYHFDDFASYKEKRFVAQYIKEKYKEFINMKDPQIDIEGGDYNIDFKQSYNIEFFEVGDDAISQIINYNFNRIQFYNDMIRINYTDLSNKVGDYPIISVDQARELLENHHYITNVPYQMPGIDHVAKVELVYINNLYEKYFMPYYRFYVELPIDEVYPGEFEGTNMKNYGIYYVPAIESSYLTNMPTYSGQFN